MPSRPKVLMTTACRAGPLYDYFGSNIRHTPLRLSGVRPISLGLRFIKQNVPGVEILEMPTAEQYRRALRRGWDIVGISFYLDETPRAMEMAESARAAGVAQVWGGNYGVLTPEARPASTVSFSATRKTKWPRRWEAAWKRWSIRRC